MNSATFATGRPPLGTHTAASPNLPIESLARFLLDLSEGAENLARLRPAVFSARYHEIIAMVSDFETIAQDLSIPVPSSDPRFAALRAGNGWNYEAQRCRGITENLARGNKRTIELFEAEIDRAFGFEVLGGSQSPLSGARREVREEFFNQLLTLMAPAPDSATPYEDTLRNIARQSQNCSDFLMDELRVVQREALALFQIAAESLTQIAESVLTSLDKGPSPASRDDTRKASLFLSQFLDWRRSTLPDAAQTFSIESTSAAEDRRLKLNRLDNLGGRTLLGWSMNVRHFAEDLLPSSPGEGNPQTTRSTTNRGLPERRRD